MIITLLILSLLILTIALTVSSILISSHLRSTYKAELFSTLLFFEVFYFTFGFYALWGQMIINTYLSAYATTEILGKISAITVLLGIPFLIFAALMFIRFTKEIARRKTSNSFILLYLGCNVFLMACFAYFLIIYPAIKILILVKYYYLLFNFLYIGYGALNLLKIKKNEIFQYNDLKNISIGFLLAMAVQSTIIYLFNNSMFLALAFIFVYFLLGGFIPIYLRYKADLSKLLPEIETSKSFEQFCAKYEISKREKEIISELCKGYSNQQIAEKLFISLQTVKDHTHRIYSKTDCTSRAQLTYMINESK